MVPRVIVVDDDAASASVVAKLLRRLNCDVSVTTEPQSAVELALSGQVDLVSLDITMPHLDGYQVLALIRSHEQSRRLPSAPVIAVTGRVTLEDKAEALARGFAAHLGKPVMVDDLRCALARALTLRSELHRTRYTVDRDALESNLRGLIDGATADSVQTVAGLSLALEQQGYQALYQALRLAYEGRADSGLQALRDFSRLVRALGAARLCTCLDELADHLGSGGDVLGTAAVLTRAEIDRVIFTLREQLHH